MKKTSIFLTTMMAGLTVAGSVPAMAEVVDGTNEADVKINGSIGKLDNTDPETNLPEESDDWINVTVDTATAFHTTVASDHQQIESANYQIKNNSGRAVSVELSQLTGTVTYVDQLLINVTGENIKNAPAPTNLVANNQAATFSGTWLFLANNEGRFNLDADATGAFANEASFFYTGSTTNLPTDLSSAIEENYTLTLKFNSIDRAGL